MMNDHISAVCVFCTLMLFRPSTPKRNAFGSRLENQSGTLRLLVTTVDRS